MLEDSIVRQTCSSKGRQPKKKEIASMADGRTMITVLVVT